MSFNFRKSVLISGLVSDECAYYRSLVEARGDLLYYASFYFLIETSNEKRWNQTLLCVATTGIFWQYQIFDRDQVPEMDPKTMLTKRNPVNKSKTKKFLNQKSWSPLFEVGMEASDAEFTKIRDEYLHPFAVAEEGGVTFRFHLCDSPEHSKANCPYLGDWKRVLERARDLEENMKEKGKGKEKQVDYVYDDEDEGEDSF